MLKKYWKKYIKNERGLTLIELLAVVVILGIIAAIAIPSIGGIIENSRRDAHIANAKMLADAARMAATTDGVADGTYTLTQLKSDKYKLINDIQIPGENGVYDGDTSKVVISKDTYKITLKDKTTTFVDGLTLDELDRSKVKLTGEK